MNALFDSDQDSLTLSKNHLFASLRFPIGAVLVIWIVFVIMRNLGIDEADYGIISRSSYGLTGIVTGPLVHGGWGHLASNSWPLFVLTFLTFYFYQRVALRAFWLIYLGTSAAVWLLARPVSHIGASGVVYGLVSFIFFNGIFRSNPRSIVLALVVLFLYSGMFEGLSPYQEGVSWESHLLGSLVGIVAANWYRGELEDDELKAHDLFAEERGAEKKPYLPAGTFDLTKQERAEIAAAEQRAREEEEARLRAEQGQGYAPYWFSPYNE
jgi:membrane associated rhomboid family serine protease